jgi:hypothetical protein
MALEVKLKNLVVETLNTENVSKAIFGEGCRELQVWTLSRASLLFLMVIFSTAGDAQTCICFCLRGESYRAILKLSCF